MTLAASFFLTITAIMLAWAIGSLIIGALVTGRWRAVR